MSNIYVNLKRTLCILATIVLLNSVASAQDYTLSSLTGDNSASSVTSSGVVAGRLPSEIFRIEEDEAATVVKVGSVQEQYRVANYVVLAAFAGLLFLGAVITGVCIHSSRRVKSKAPMTMVSA